MQIIRDIEEVGNAVSSLRLARRGDRAETIALVPTMGALHAGHLALVEEAKRRSDRVVATIFVNPLQFAAGEDLDRYPRQEQADAAMLEEGGCDLLWLPSVRDIYPDDFATSVSVKGVSERWEGEARPGHFDGVATVVAKLLLSVRPDMALFGEKDFQQLAVIRRMVADLSIGVDVIGIPTVRDADGLALSSRNAYLSPDDRASAAALPRTLEQVRDRIAAGEDVSAAIARGEEDLGKAGFTRIDYLALVDSKTLEPSASPGVDQRLIAAATIGSTRLIDNIPFGTDAIPAR